MQLSFVLGIPVPLSAFQEQEGIVLPIPKQDQSR